MVLFKQNGWWLILPFEGSTSILKIDERDARHLMYTMKRDYTSKYICYYEDTQNI